jgi:hypothetical protein
MRVSALCSFPARLNARIKALSSALPVWCTPSSVITQGNKLRGLVVHGTLRENCTAELMKRRRRGDRAVME